MVATKLFADEFSNSKHEKNYTKFQGRKPVFFFQRILRHFPCWAVRVSGSRDGSRLPTLLFRAKVVNGDSLISLGRKPHLRTSGLWKALVGITDGDALTPPPPSRAGERK
jgi:hypothetical protein